MTTALIFIPIFIGLSCSLVVIAADLLTPGQKAPETTPAPKSSKAAIA